MSDPTTPPFSVDITPWNIQSLNRMITVFNEQYADASNRVSAWSKFFLNTPFRFESAFPVTEKEVQVRLSTLDCITYVYNVIALSGANNFEDFVERLFAIRYFDEGQGPASTTVSHGNFFDFACESLLFNCIDKGILTDVTNHIVEQEKLEPVCMELSPVQRPKAHDPEQSLVSPKYKGRAINTQIIPSEEIRPTNMPVLPGDLIVFTKGATDKHGNKNPTFVCHCAFADIIQGQQLGFIHSTKSYYLSERYPGPLAVIKTLPGHPDKKLPGVAYGCEYLGDDKIVKMDGVNYHGYHQDHKRTLASYAAENFYGIKVLRMTQEV